MMNYYEREWKQMHHSNGPVRIYKARPNDNGGGGSGSGDGGADAGVINKGADTNELNITYVLLNRLVWDIGVCTIYYDHMLYV